MSERHVLNEIFAEMNREMFDDTPEYKRYQDVTHGRTTVREDKSYDDDMDHRNMEDYDDYDR